MKAGTDEAALGRVENLCAAVGLALGIGPAHGVSFGVPFGGPVGVSRAASGEISLVRRKKRE
jgi:hypothetical protein